MWYTGQITSLLSYCTCRSLYYMGIKSIRKRGSYQESLVWLEFFVFVSVLLLLLFCCCFEGKGGGESVSFCLFVCLFLLVCCFWCYSAIAVIIGICRKFIFSEFEKCLRRVFLYLHFFYRDTKYCLLCRGVGVWSWGKRVGIMDEESQVRGCYNILVYLRTNQPGNNVGSPLRRTHEHRRQQQTNNLPLQGHWRKRDAAIVVVVEVLLYVHRNRRLIRDGSPGRPPRLSHSSWTLTLPLCFHVA